MSITQVSAEAYTIPTDHAEADGTFAWSRTTVVLVEVTAAGTTGIGWTYGPAGCVDVVADLIAPAVRDLGVSEGPAMHRRMLDATRNATRPGLVSLAISAVDNAFWDLRARLLGVPLHVLLGRARAAAPVYGSGGFTTYDAAQLQEQIEGWRGQGIRQIKIKIGESWGDEENRDLARVDNALEALDGDTLFVDANGGYGVKQAVRVGRALEQRGVAWFEEPVSSDDHAGLRYLREHLELIDVAAGEYGWGLDYFQGMLSDGCVDCLQVDVTRCGGITAWQRIAAVAEAHHLEISAHCAPLQHVALGVSTPNLRHLEYFHDHVRIESLLFEETPEPRKGVLYPCVGAGLGLELNRPRIERFRVR